MRRRFPALDVRQKNVLLRLVEMMNLIDEQDRLLPGCAEPIRGRGEHAAHFGDIAFHAADPNKFCVRHLGDDARQRGLSSAGRPVRKSPRASDRLRSRDAKVCPARECVPGRQIPRASAAASAWRAAQRGLQFQSPALPRIDPAREKLRRAREAGNRCLLRAIVLHCADKHIAACAANAR